MNINKIKILQNKSHRLVPGLYLRQCRGTSLKEPLKS